MKWIKHDTDANQDAKLQNVLLDYGLEGYGLYWYCIELIAGKVDKDNITFDLEHDARIIARNTGSTAQRVEEMMRYFVEIGLFENAGGVITCMKLAKRLDKSMTSNPEMRQIIDRLKNIESCLSHDEDAKSHDSVMIESEIIMQDKTRLEEIKQTHGSSDDKPANDSKAKKPYPEEFEQLWSEKPERLGTNPKNKAYIAYKARIKSGASHQEILEGVIRYRRFCIAEQKINSPFVMQMATFLGPDEHYKEIAATQQAQGRRINEL